MTFAATCHSDARARPESISDRLSHSCGIPLSNPMNATEIPLALPATGTDNLLQIGPPHFRRKPNEKAIRLRATHLAGQLVTIERTDSQTILRGTVQTYFQKQMAQETARLEAPNTIIINRILVRGTCERPGDQSTDHF